MRVNPTRMELLRLKKRSRLAQRGHKLLKDKRDGLMQEFLAIIRRAKELRAQVDSLITSSLQHFIYAQAAMLPEATMILQQATPYAISLNTTQAQIMGVTIPHFTATVTKREGGTIGVWETSRELDVAMASFQILLPLLLELASVEKTAELLAIEIETTRRRVNALEYIVLPQLQHTIKYIRMKLDEQERASLVSTMAVKQHIR